MGLILLHMHAVARNAYPLLYQKVSGVLISCWEREAIPLLRKLISAATGNLMQQISF